MWKLYSRSSDAVAIESTAGALSRVLPGQAMLGTVRYIDYQRRGPSLGYFFGHFLYKRESFSHEKEIRAIIQDVPDDSEIRDLQPCPEIGRPIHVDLAQLISGVRVSPDAADWFLDLVIGVSRRYRLGIEPKRSDLALDPIL